MPAYASGEASPETRRLVEDHLAHCFVCLQAFGKEDKTDDILKEIGPGGIPSNGERLLLRTRRLVFALGTGGLFFFASVLAVFVRIVVNGIANLSLPILPGPRLFWLGTLAFSFVLYLLFLFMAKAQAMRAKKKHRVILLLSAAWFLALTTAAYHLLVAETFWLALLGCLLILIALVFTFIHLPKLPYFTAITVLVLILMNGFLISLAAVGAWKDLSEFAFEPAAELGHPNESIPLENAVHIDMKSLGVEFISWEEIHQMPGVMMSTEDRIVQAFYQGNGQRVYLTMAKMKSHTKAHAYYASWKKKVSSGVRLMHVEMFGQVFRSYDLFRSRECLAWKTENWVITIEIPGPYSSAWPLAKRIKDLVVRSFRS
jgi:hypothetical protein